MKKPRNHAHAAGAEHHKVFFVNADGEHHLSNKQSNTVECYVRMIIVNQNNECTFKSVQSGAACAFNFVFVG